MNEPIILKIASNELNDINEKEVVKVAGILRRFENWFRTFLDSEYSEDVDAIKFQTDELKESISDLSNQLNRLDSAIKDLDVVDYRAALVEVKRILPEVYTSLINLNSATSKAEADLPEVVKEYQRKQNPEELYITKDDPHKYLDQLSKDYPFPLKGIIDVQSIPHFSSFNEGDVVISNKSLDAIARYLKARLSKYGIVDDDRLNRVMIALSNNIKKGILAGKIIGVKPISAKDFGKEQKARFANQMLVTVETDKISVPGSGLDLQLEVELLDRKISRENVNILNVRRIKDIKIFADQNYKDSEEFTESTNLIQPDPQAKPQPEDEDENNLVITSEDLKAPLFKTAGRPSHEGARNILLDAFKQVMGREPTLPEIQGAQAVAWLETNYGGGWKSTGRGSNNWGAIQCCLPDRKTGVCPPNSFLYTDSSPQKDGSSKRYSVCFKSYSSPLEGAKDLIKKLFVDRPSVTAALNAGSAAAFSANMYDTKYFQGFGKNREERVANHAKTIKGVLKYINKSLKEEPAVGGGVSVEDIPTIEEAKNLQPKQPKEPKQPNDITLPGTSDNSIAGIFNNLMKMLLSEDESDFHKIIRRAVEKQVLPTTKLLLKINSSPLYSSEGNINSAPARAELCKILCTALREKIEAINEVHSDGNDFEIEIKATGEPITVMSAVNEITNKVINEFKNAMLSTLHKKASSTGLNINFDYSIRINQKSKLPFFDIEMVDKFNKKFKYAMVL